MRPFPTLLAIAAAALALRCSRDPSESGGAPPAGPPTTLASGLVLQELRLGRGDAATDGAYLALDYDARVAAVGGVARGDPPYDSTRGGEPFLAKLGTTPLLPGFTEGVRGMKEGGRRRLTIPPALAYGALGKGEVPPDATLQYDVELVDLFERLPSGLQYRVVDAGEGEPPKQGERVVVEFREWLLESGRELASSKALGRSLEIELGHGEALPGLETALTMMKPRARWIVALPPELGYGEHAHPPLLYPGQDVVIDVTLGGTRPH